MTVFALTFVVGVSSGMETFLGLFSTIEKAEEIADKHARKMSYTKDHYRIEKIEIDKETNIIIAEW